MKTTFVAWNLGKKQLEGDLVELMLENGVDVAILCEAGQVTQQGIQALEPSLKVLDGLQGSPFVTPKVKLVWREGGHLKLKLLHVDTRFSVYKISPPLEPTLVVALHLPDKRSEPDPYSREATAQLVAGRIAQFEDKTGISRTIVAGDFNFNPFDRAMTGVYHFNARPCLREAKRVRGGSDPNEKRPFYNPTWNLLGDWNGPPGSYYFKGKGVLRWNLLDQVLLRPTLGSQLQRCEILNTTGKQELTQSATGLLRKGYSDHLPLLFTLGT